LDRLGLEGLSDGARSARLRALLEFLGVCCDEGGLGLGWSGLGERERLGGRCLFGGKGLLPL
jgi:hypothetical protein